MKVLWLFTFLLLLPGLSDDGKKQGRQGNALYHKEQYAEAAQAYTTGLTAYTNGKTDLTYYGLQHNLGAAWYRQQDFAKAQPFFDKALASALSEADFSRASYNAGNNAFRNQQAEAALAYYQKALLANPDNEEAKYNYEFVKRQMQQQQQQGSDNQDQQNQDQQNQDQQNQDQQNQDQQNQEQQNQDQQNQDQQNQDQQNQEQQEQDQQQEGEQEKKPSEQLSRQQAERILQALENSEEQLLREVQKRKGRPRRVEKDW